MKQFSLFYTVVLIVVFSGCGQQTPATADTLPLPQKEKVKQAGSPGAGFYKVEPITTKNTNDMNDQPVYSKPAELQIHQGSFFSYALPSGWKVGEDGQFAITLVAPDRKALTVMVGNAGLMPNYPPAQFVYEKMMALRPSALQFGQPANTAPITGFQQAYRFPVSYQVQGENCQGEVTCHVSNYYGGCVMAMTAALSTAAQWPDYSTWLPQVSRQMSAINGAAFGARGIMQQNLRNSVAFSEAAKSYREWSQKNWQEVTDDRNRSVDDRNYQFRENIGGIQTYNNPYGNQTPVELSNQYKYYWMNASGEIVGTNDAGVNPNDGSTVEWKAMPRKEKY